jgi:hypothetical protein
MYMRRLKSVRYTLNARLPSWSHPDIRIGVADQVTFEFQHSDVVVREHVEEALKGAMREHPRRMGRVERDRCCTKVSLLVDVSGCVGVCGREGDGGEPLPLYEVGETPPAYVEG